MAQGTCSIEGCEGKTVARGWCGTHWKRWKRTGDPGRPEIRTHAAVKGECSVEGCTSVSTAQGLCQMHYRRWRRHGDSSVVMLAAGVLQCITGDCGEPVHAKGMCHIHYVRWLRHGDPHANFFDVSSRQARFWSRVDKDGPLPAYDPSLGPCWLWMAALNDLGYGMAQYRQDGSVYVLAHRIAYMIDAGPIPEGLQLDHLCRVRNCVNPSHLEPVTGAENQRRAAEARRRERGLTA